MTCRSTRLRNSRLPSAPYRYEVPRAVQPPARLVAEGVGDEARGGEAGPVQVSAGELGAADEQFARDADGDTAQAPVDDVQAGAEQWPPDRWGSPGRAGHFLEGDDHGGLGGTVCVEEPDARMGGKPLDDIEGAQLAAGDDGAQRRQIGDVEGGECGRRDERQRRPGGADRVGEAAAEPLLAPDQDDGAAGAQRREDLQNRGVEADRRELKHARFAVNAEVGGTRFDKVRQTAVPDHDSLGAARRT